MQVLVAAFQLPPTGLTSLTPLTCNSGAVIAVAVELASVWQLLQFLPMNACEANTDGCRPVAGGIAWQVPHAAWVPFTTVQVGVFAETPPVKDPWQYTEQVAVAGFQPGKDTGAGGGPT